jgi:hypothetical protein
MRVLSHAFISFGDLGLLLLMRLLLHASISTGYLGLLLEMRLSSHASISTGDSGPFTANEIIISSLYINRRYKHFYPGRDYNLTPLYQPGSSVFLLKMILLSQASVSTGYLGLFNANEIIPRFYINRIFRPFYCK